MKNSSHSLILLIAVAFGFCVDAYSEEKNILKEKRKSDTWYKIELPFQYVVPENPPAGTTVDPFAAPGTGWHPGPSNLENYRAWMLANEFIYRSILREQYRLPVSSSGRSTLFSSFSEDRLYVVKTESLHSGNKLVLLVNLDSLEVGIISR